MHHTPSTAERYALKAHGDQSYGGNPYWHHLEAVVGILTNEIDRRHLTANTIRVAWLHDTLEDTPVTYMDLWREFGRDVADAVLACSGFGGNRESRQAQIAENIKFLRLSAPEAYHMAVAVKVADRIANVEASAADSPRLHRMYRAEREAFFEGIARFAPDNLQQRLNRAYSKGF